MKQYNDISAQEISWVKSNKAALGSTKGVKHLYYPESMSELEALVRELDRGRHPYLVIGWSSNTLFLPSYKIDNVICIKHLKHWEETDTHIVCDCGVNISSLSKEMVKKGYIGFEGLTDLPGTVAAAVYGNCGCRGCSVNSLVDYFTLLLPSGEIKRLTPQDLQLSYRSSTLKRGETKGVILQVFMKINRGNAEELSRIAEKNHQIRMQRQPSPANNLGTTFVLGNPNLAGRMCNFLERWLQRWTKNDVTSFSCLLKILGKGRFAPYTYRKERYMFLDEKSHVLFPKYVKFIKGLYPEAQLEIEIRQ